NMEPVPLPNRCWSLGRVLAGYVGSRPQHERVVVLATGGLSHWIFTPEMGRVNESFDRECLSKLAAGQAGTLAQLSAEAIRERAGNGGLELLCWLCMAGSVTGPGEVIFYEPMHKWATGMAGLSMGAGAATAGGTQK